MNIMILSKKHVWTEEDIEFLRINYEKMFNKELAKHLGTSETSVNQKLSKLKLKRKIRHTVVGFRRGHRWSKEDDLFLKNNCENLKDKELAKIFGVSRISITHRLSRLGIKRINKHWGEKNSGQFVGHEWTEKEEQFIINNFNKLTNDELGKKLNIKNYVIQRKLAKLGLKRSKEAIYERNVKKAKRPERMAFIRELGKRVQSDPLLVKKRIEAFHNSPKVKEYQKIAGNRLRRPEVRANNLKAIHESEKLKEHARNLMRRINSDPVLTKKRIDALKSAFKKYCMDPNSKYMKGLLGKNNYFYVDGRAREPYSSDWTNWLKKTIIERDNYICQECGIKYGTIRFEVHHIDGNKRNCDPINLILLCYKCHLPTKHDRTGKYIKYYKEKMNNRFNIKN